MTTLICGNNYFNAWLQVHYKYLQVITTTTTLICRKKYNCKHTHFNLWLELHLQVQL